MKGKISKKYRMESLCSKSMDEYLLQIQKMKTVKKIMHKFNYIERSDFFSMKRPHKKNKKSREVVNVCKIYN